LPRRNVIIGADYSQARRQRHAKAARPKPAAAGRSIPAAVTPAAIPGAVSTAPAGRVAIIFGRIRNICGLNATVGAPVALLEEEAGPNDGHDDQHKKNEERQAQG
jgi:hypothetical protein